MQQPGLMFCCLPSIFFLPIFETILSLFPHLLCIFYNEILTVFLFETKSHNVAVAGLELAF